MALAAALEEIIVGVMVMQNLDIPGGTMEEVDGPQVEELEVYSAEVAAVVQDQRLVAEGA